MDFDKSERAEFLAGGVVVRPVSFREFKRYRGRLSGPNEKRRWVNLGALGAAECWAGETIVDGGAAVYVLLNVNAPGGRVFVACFRRIEDQDHDNVRLAMEVVIEGLKEEELLLDAGWRN